MLWIARVTVGPFSPFEEIVCPNQSKYLHLVPTALALVWTQCVSLAGVRSSHIWGLIRTGNLFAHN